MALTDPGGNSRRVIWYDLPIPITLAGTVYAGDMVGYSTGYKQADDDGAIPAQMIACESGVSGDVITCALRAYLDGYTLGTVNGLAYLSNTAGQMTETETQQIVGRIITASTVLVDLQPVTAGKLTLDFSGLASGAYGLKSVVVQTSAKSDGIAGYFEGHVAGTPTGASYALGAWLNVDTAPGNVDLRGADFGIYASGQDLSNAQLYGINIDMHASLANPPAAHYPIRFNCSAAGDTPDGMFLATNHEAVASTVIGGETAAKVGVVAASIQGTTYYFRYYAGTG